MRICVSSTGCEWTSPVDLRFGRCAYFVIYDTDTKEVKSIENKGISSPSGAGIAAAQTVIDSNADVVLTGNLGPNAMSLLKANDIKIMEVYSKTVDKAVNQYLNSDTKAIDKAVPAHFGMGGGNRHRGEW